MDGTTTKGCKGPPGGHTRRQVPAVRFLRVACTSVDAVSPHKPRPDQLAKMKTIKTDAEEMLRVYQRSCKEIAEPQ